MQTLDATESGVLLPSVGTPDHLLLQLAVIGPLLLTASSRAESNYAGRIHQAARLLDAACFSRCRCRQVVVVACWEGMIDDLYTFLECLRENS